MSYYGYLLIIVLLTIIPQILVHVTYNKYSQISVGNGKNGERLVNEMLYNNGVNDVRVERIGGVLSDHYDSRKKVIRLSSSNFEHPTIASIAVAAHETGHALQDNRGYFFLRLRHALGPTAILASKTSWIFIYLGFIMFFSPMIYLGIIMLAVVVLFDFVTLPVEINASRRAKQYLISTGTYTSDEIAGASKVLSAAALTYVAATLAGVLQLIRLLANARRD